MKSGPLIAVTTTIFTLSILGLLFKSPANATTMTLATGCTWFDNFDGPALDSNWSWVREDSTHWSLSALPGFLRIITQPKDVWTTSNDAPVLLHSLQPSACDDFEIRTRILISPTANYHQGGLIIYSDDDNYVRLTYAWINGPTFEFGREIGSVFQPIQVTAPPGLNDFHLKIVKSGTDYYGYYSLDGADWTSVGSYTNVTISPAKIGLLAFNGENMTTIEIPANFDYFRLGGLYSISGRVTDDKGNGVLGVTLTAGSGSSAVTDASGYYTITNLIIGTYTITPTLTGYRFAPAAVSSITVPPDSKGKDFRIRPLPTRFLDLPLDYSRLPQDFGQILQGNEAGTGKGPQRVNSWFDHTFPEYSVNNNLTRWDGNYYDFSQRSSQIGSSWYDGHNGIDFQHLTAVSNEPVYAAATGIVTNTVSGCVKGVPTCPSLYGNQVWIDHQNGYATLYGHLQSISVTNGTNITNIVTQPLGIMGDTGRSDGTHLHFGLYYDQNGDGRWTPDEVVDPFGWDPSVTNHSGSDLWNSFSQDVWKYARLLSQTVGTTGTTLTSLSGKKTLFVPAGALTSTLTLRFGDAPPIAMPSAQLRSAGQSFLLQVLEWLLGNSSSRNQVASPSFAQPVTVVVTYGLNETRHLDTSQLAFFRWIPTTGAWVSLPTSVDRPLNRATVQTTETGNFDLQAPLLCPTDSREVDDTYSSAHRIMADGTIVNDLFDIAQDEDWFRLDAIGGIHYIVQTRNLAAGVDTILQVYDLDGTTVLASDDNSGGGKTSRLVWQAPQDGPYFIRVSQALGSSFGCSASYQLRVLLEGDLFLPFIRK